MFKELCCFFALLTCVAPILSAAPLTAQDDKIAHFTGSATVTSTLIKLWQWQEPKHEITVTSRMGASSAAGVLGIAKEAYDIRRGGQEARRDAPYDLLADCLGIAFAQFLTWEF